ncbi:MAG TPA: peptidoglycan-binding protein, partial [Polyangiaceae bacterium]|nr:peptidoglycan-binding protein [Polyangiaceae bacterium]
QQIEQVIKSPGLPQIQTATGPLAPVIVPVTTDKAAPAIVVSPSPAVPTASKAPTPEQIAKVLGTRLLQRGMAGTDVLGWQQWLARDGFPSLGLDGKFGPATSAATKTWQAQRGLTPDGKVGPNTKAAIGRPPSAPVALPAAAAAKAAPQAPAAASGALPSVAFGSRLMKLGVVGTDVAAWQQQLARDGLPVTIDGKFGPGTDAATRAWQKQRGLGADGKVGKDTLAKIGTKPVAATVAPRAAAAPAPSPAATAASIPSGKLSLDQFPDPNPSAPVIKRGSPKSDYVASFQKVLNTFGYPVGTPDGVFGANTETQTKAFQAWALGFYKDSRITPDGSVGPITRRLVRMRAAELLRDSGKAA